MKRYSLIITAAFLIILMSLAADAGEKAFESRPEAGYREKFTAQKIVAKLSRENLVKIRHIEVISKNFGFINYRPVKNDYYKARVYVSMGDIINSKKLLQKNRKDIEALLEKIAREYARSADILLDKSSVKISGFHMAANDQSDREKKEKLNTNRKRIDVVVSRINSGAEAFKQKRFLASIMHYRNAKGVSILILRDLSRPHERHKINEKYKVDLADNRNNVYKKDI